MQGRGVAVRVLIAWVVVFDLNADGQGEPELTDKSGLE